MQFNISLLLFLTALGLNLWYSFCIVYHLIRFGIGTKPKILAFIFFIGSFALFVIAINAYSQIDWQKILQQIIQKIHYFQLL